MSLHAQRGQTFPIWAFGTLTVLTMLVLALSYGQMIAWQMRAMNAADAAAKGMLSVQTTQWNETEATLHAAAVEEYRLRVTMNDLLEVIRGNGGCTTGSGSTSCSALYASLRQNYLDSLQRYTNDVSTLGQLSWPTFSTQVTEIQSALSQYQANCGQTNGGDCAFQYTLVEATPRPTEYLEDVYADCCNAEVGGGTSGASVKLDLTPMEIEVVACANVQPWLPNFWNWNASTYQVVGRAAAMSIMDTQEFMWVGTMINPTSTTNAVFQPTEYPESSSDAPVGLANSDQYYQVDFGYNISGSTYEDNSTSNGTGGYTLNNLVYPGMMVFDGWWTAMRIQPFAGQLTPGVSYTCK